jgi:NAD(P)-dependent dehydrogenase (short-subunit alcohol dehydrogenase family)
MPVFVVTGARGGMGLEYIRQLSESEDNTVFAIIRDTKANITDLRTVETQAKGLVHVVGCELSSDESALALGTKVSAHLKPGQKIDMIINNAAMLDCADEKAQHISVSNLTKHINANVGGPARIQQALLPLLKENGVIANVTSGMGSKGMLSQGRISPRVPSYGISKAALNMLTVYQAYELKGRAIVVALDPGHVKTASGGDGATLEIADSVRQNIATLKGVKAEDSGRFLLYNGTEMPW